jgi:hypothetical protein
VASVEIIRRWASRPTTNAISVVQLSHLTDEYTPSSSDLGFISLSLNQRNTRDMRSDPQGSLHRRTPRIVISARISFFHKSNLRKVEIPIQSEFLKTTSMHIFAIVSSFTGNKDFYTNKNKNNNINKDKMSATKTKMYIHRVCLQPNPHDFGRTSFTN